MTVREFSSAGRASALQAGCHRFEPCNSHHHLLSTEDASVCCWHSLPEKYGPVVQLVRTLACHARGRGFEPHPGRQIDRRDASVVLFASVAQLVERGTENPCVVGSIPTGGTNPYILGLLRTATHVRQPAEKL